MTKLSLCIASQCLTVDTDAPASITNIGRYQELTCKLNKFVCLQPVENLFCDVIKPVGKLNGELLYNNQSLGTNLLGRVILKLLELNWEKLFDINNAHPFRRGVQPHMHMSKDAQKCLDTETKCNF